MNVLSNSSNVQCAIELTINEILNWTEQWPFYLVYNTTHTTNEKILQNYKNKD